MAATVSIPDLDYAAILMIAVLMVTAAAVAMGRWGRATSHALLPVRDPIFIGIVVAGIAVAAVLSQVISATEMWYATVIIAAMDIGYLLGSLVSDPADYIYADLPSDDIGDSEVGPVVYYTRKGQKYIVPQTFGAILGNMFGLRCPLQMDLNGVRFRRGMSVSNKIRRIDVPAINIASKHEVEYRTKGCCRLGHYRMTDPDGGDRLEPRYLLYRTIECHSIVWAETVTEDPREFYEHRDTWIAARDAVGVERQKGVRETVRANVGIIDKSGELLSKSLNLGLDSSDADDLIAYAEMDMRRLEKKRKGGDGDVDDGDERQESS